MRTLAWAVVLTFAISSPHAAPLTPFAQQVADLLEPNPPKHLAPVQGGRDVLTVDPKERAAAGLRLGQSMDDVIAVWGKPHGLEVVERWDAAARAFYRQVQLTYGNGLRFAFRDDVLEAINVQGLDGAHLAGGPAFGATREAVRQALGEPAGRFDERVWFYTVGGTPLRLQFIARVREREPLLRAIGIGEHHEAWKTVDP